MIDFRDLMRPPVGARDLRRVSAAALARPMPGGLDLLDRLGLTYRLGLLRAFALVASPFYDPARARSHDPPAHPQWPTTASHPQHHVEAMTLSGASIEQIEQYLDSLALEDDELSALWLLAWSQRPSPPTAPIARPPTLAAVEAMRRT